MTLSIIKFRQVKFCRLDLGKETWWWGTLKWHTVNSVSRGSEHQVLCFVTTLPPPSLSPCVDCFLLLSYQHIGHMVLAFPITRLCMNYWLIMWVIYTLWSIATDTTIQPLIKTLKSCRDKLVFFGDNEGYEDRIIKPISEEHMSCILLYYLLKPGRASL